MKKIGSINAENKDAVAKQITATEMFEKDPTRLVEKAVKGMLPKNILGSALFRNLYVFAGSEHSHEAQSPKAINLNDLK